MQQLLQHFQRLLSNASYRLFAIGSGRLQSNAIFYARMAAASPERYWSSHSVYLDSRTFRRRRRRGINLIHQVGAVTSELTRHYEIRCHGRQQRKKKLLLSFDDLNMYEYANFARPSARKGERERWIGETFISLLRHGDRTRWPTRGLTYIWASLRSEWTRFRRETSAKWEKRKNATGRSLERVILDDVFFRRQGTWSDRKSWEESEIRASWLA